jgi:small subunit ribosomal protein S1
MLAASEAAPGEGPAAPADAPAAQAAPAQAREPARASEPDAEAAPEHDDAPMEVEPEAPPAPNPGEIVRGRVSSVSESGHIALVNRLVDRQAARKALDDAREQRRRVRGIVFGFNRGGFDVLVGGIRVFCPASGMSLEPIETPEVFLGRKLEFTVPPQKPGLSGVVLSRRTILERELRKARKARMRSLKQGDRLHGHITQVREFGAFVDLGDGLEGLVHMSELTWQRGVRPVDAVRPGDEVDVVVLRVQPEGRRDRYGRVSLSIRAALPDPWDVQAEAITEGTARKGRVIKTAEFGAFVEIAPGIEGLLHVSELGRDLVHASHAIAEGAEIDVVIERVDRQQRRISLSKLSPGEAKAIAEGAASSEKPRSLKPGTQVTVVVERVEHHGVQVQVKGVLGRRGRGYISNRDLGNLEGSDRRKTLAVGTSIEVKIVGTDRDGGLRCSVRAKQVDEERRAVQDYRKEASRQGFGTFGDLLRAKLNK